MTIKPPTEAEWKRRWILLNTLRIGGVVLALLGLLIWRRGLGGFQDELIGQVMLVLGAVETFLVPILFSRIWKSRDRDLL